MDKESINHVPEAIQIVSIERISLFRVLTPERTIQHGRPFRQTSKEKYHPWSQYLVASDSRTNPYGEKQWKGKGTGMFNLGQNTRGDLTYMVIIARHASAYYRNDVDK